MRIGRRSKAQVARVRDLVFERDGHECVVFERASECAGGLTVVEDRTLDLSVVYALWASDIFDRR